MAVSKKLKIPLAEDELAAIVTALRETLDRDRYLYAPRLEPFKSALAKLDPARMPEPKTSHRRDR